MYNIVKYVMCVVIYNIVHRLYTEVLTLATLGPITLSFSTSNVILTEHEIFFYTWKKSEHSNKRDPLFLFLCFCFFVFAITWLWQRVNKATSSQIHNCIKDQVDGDCATGCGRQLSVSRG